MCYTKVAETRIYIVRIQLKVSSREQTVMDAAIARRVLRLACASESIMGSAIFIGSIVVRAYTQCCIIDTS